MPTVVITRYDEELDPVLAEYWKKRIFSEPHPQHLRKLLRRGYLADIERISCERNLRLRPLLTLLRVLNVTPPQGLAAVLIHRVECHHCAECNTQFSSGSEWQIIAAIADEFKAYPSLLDYLVSARP